MLVRVGRLGMAPALRILTEAALGLGRQGTPEGVEVRLDLLGVTARYARAPSRGDHLRLRRLADGALNERLRHLVLQCRALSCALMTGSEHPGPAQVRSAIGVAVVTMLVS
jgi:hypothetical protein